MPQDKRKDAFFQNMEGLDLSLSYSDVRLRTGYSEVIPSNVSLVTRFTRNVPLRAPIASAAMDTVTEAPMAIAIAKAGGIGVIHRAMPAEDQAAHVTRVKLHLNGLIEKPIFAKRDETIRAIMERRDKKGYEFHTFPVIDDSRKLLGLLTRNDFDLSLDRSQTAASVMTPVKDLVTAPAGTSLHDAHNRLVKAKKKVLPLVDSEGKLAGMYVYSDVSRLVMRNSDSYCTDESGHLRVAAAIGTGEDELQRAELLSKAGCDVIVIDTAHGDSKSVIDMIMALKRSPQIKADIMAGNVSEGPSARRLADAGADGIKVGQGPGSICTTRIIAGVGRPQLTAVHECERAIRGYGVPVCADGGIRFSGDVTIALGAGASSVMLGMMLAGTEESPGEMREVPNHGRVKVYRGMGSQAAMEASRAARARYQQADAAPEKLVPEGVESVVPYQGSVSEIANRILGGLRSGMGYTGSPDIETLQKNADFFRITPAGLSESFPHDVIIGGRKI